MGEYNLQKCEQFFEFKSKLVFSKNYRRLDGKTQLFSSKKGDHFRNRLIHTEEVRQIAEKIAKGINLQLKKSIINIDLVECIAIAHDFGHTPFGHVGERTLQAIVSKQDSLGGLLSLNETNKKLFFKHNINSVRLLIEEFKDDIPWEILDGVLKHSNLNYEYKEDNGISSLISGTEYDKIFYQYKDSKLSLTIEGQIVFLTDEIAQRYSDFEDTFRAKNINILNRLIKIMQIDLESYNEFSCKKYIDKIRDYLIDNVISESSINITNNIESINSQNALDFFSKTKIIDFDLKGKEFNNQLEQFIKECIFNIDELRKEDERNKHIIKQLFKAYYNNCFQISGEYFINFINKIYKVKRKLVFNNETIIKYKNVVDNNFIYNDKIDSKKFRVFIDELKKVEHDNENKDASLIKLYCEYIRSIVFYISSMTDNYALKSFEFMYGK